MIANKIYLVTRNARDKVQLVIAELEQNGNTFTIKRTTGQFGGKLTPQVEIKIEKGKVNRTALQQAELEFNSKVKGYLDKGYKRLDSLTKEEFKNITATRMDELVPVLKSDGNGNFKPMLAKQSEKCQSSIFNKTLKNSKKLNGVRCMIKLDHESGEIVTISRGGKDYNGSTKHITKNLEKVFNLYPNIILDGELYHHGHYLQEISGIARLKEWEERCSLLQYWIYDIADDTLTFDEREEILEDLREIIEEKHPTIQLLKHVETNTWMEMQKLHDQWVAEGFEGLVARKPDKKYGYGKRSSDMIKLKLYSDAEFEIIDYRDGLREEDFCFVCQTQDGKPFAAKPIGDRELKSWYMENVDDLIGKFGVVKYFEWSKDGIPLQPVFQAVRYDLD